MSRAALWHQEGNIKERERHAEEIFETAVEQGRQRSRSTLPLWGPDDSFHLNPLLLRNTIQSPYFQKCCNNLLDWNAVIDEIYYQVKHLQPFGTDKTPSTAFCLLLRMLTLRMTDRQMDLTLKHEDSPYIRGIGFLYLRYAGPPDQIWDWIYPYLQDEEEFVVEAKHNAKTLTMGEFVRNLFSSRDYYGTPLPRLPIQVERDIKVKLLQADKVAERAQHHFKNQSRMRYFQTLGNEIMALYGDEDNPITWYRAVIDRVLTRDEASGHKLKYPKFIVTFPEYGNTETVTLGEVDILDGAWKDDKPGSSSRSDRRDERDLYEEVRRRERETVTADKRWARRPPTTKTMLSQQQRHSVQDDVPSRRSKPPPANPAAQPDVAAPAPKKRTAEELAAIAEKKRKLMAKYG